MSHRLNTLGLKLNYIADVNDFRDIFLNSARQTHQISGSKLGNSLYYTVREQGHEINSYLDTQNRTN